MNGLILLIGLIIIVGGFYLASMINRMKMQRDMWRESAFAITEMYNNLLLENKINEEISQIPQKYFNKNKIGLN